MGQQDVIEFLERNPDKRFFGRDIEEALGFRLYSLSASLKKLREQDAVGYKRKDAGNSRSAYEYWHKDMPDVIVYPWNCTPSGNI